MPEQESGPARALGSRAHRRCFGRVALLVVCALTGLLIAEGLAAGSAATNDGARALTPDELAHHDTGPPPDGAPSGAEVTQQAQQARDSDQGRRERAASRNAYRGLSGSEALGVLREKHPELAAAVPPAVRKLGRVVRYLDGGMGALVAGSGGAQGVVQSTMPLRATTGSGVPEPVDASLSDQGDRFAAINPATPIEFPKDAGGRVRVGPVGLWFDSSAHRGPGVLRDGKVFYANTAADADTTLLSLPTGAETFTTLRSPASPEEIRLRFDLPAGETLQASSSPGGAEIRSGTKVVATVSPPTAHDAQKQSVAVTSTVEGSTLVVHVAHRSLDVAYPIVVDPQVGVLEPDGWVWNRYDSPGWGTYQSPGSQNWQLWRPEYGNFPWFGSRGLVTYGTLNQNSSYDYYPVNTVSEWNYYGEFWRSSTAYVYGFEEWNSLAPGYAGGGWVPPCAYSGIYSLSDGWENYAGRACPTANISSHALVCAGNNCDPATSPGHYPNYTVFGTQGQGYAANFAYDLYAANVYLTDRDYPTFSGGPPSGWTDDTTFSVGASQTGLGVNQLTVGSFSPGWQPAGWSSNCSAEPNYHCPASASLNVSTTGLPEGINQITATATTLSGHTLNGYPGQVKIDRTPPTFGAVTGSVVDHENQTGSSADHRNEGLYGSSYSLSAPANDAESGVASIEVFVDGISQRSNGGYQAGAGCDGCGSLLSWTLNTDSYPDGDHTITIVARDQVADPNGNAAGPHIAVSTIPVTVNRRGDIYHATMYDGPPGSNQNQLGQEWAEAGTLNMRHQTPDDISTLGTVACSSDPAGCVQLRTRTTRGGSANDDYYVGTATWHNDPQLLGETQLLAPANQQLGTPTQTGILSSALMPWQHAPPAHGSSFTEYDTSQTTVVEGTQHTVTIQLWLDQQTALPLREDTLDNGSVTEDQYFDYDRQRTLVASYPSDEFSVSQPTNLGQSKSETISNDPTPTPDNPPPSEQDRMTEATAFRSQFGLPSDPGTVQGVIDDPANDASVDQFGTPLSPPELADMTQRLAVQAAAPQVDAYGTAHATDYAGTYIDQTQGGLVYVGFVANGPAHMQDLQATFPYPSRLRLFTPARSLSTLSALNDQVVTDWEAGTITGVTVTGVGINTQANVVEVATPSGTVADTLLLQAKYGLGVVAVAGTPTDSSASSFTFPVPPVDSGLFMYHVTPTGTTGCTIGFNVYRGGFASVSRHFYALSAGHCGGFGASWRHPSNGPIFGDGRDNTVMPPPTGGNVAYSDSQVLSLRFGHTNRIFLRSAAGNNPVHQGRITSQIHQAQRGAIICDAGGSSQAVHCGELADYRVSHAEDNGAYVRGLTEVDYHGRCDVRAGDSGAPVFYSTAALGLVTAQYDDGCGSDTHKNPEGDRMLYSPIDQVLGDMKTTLYTGG